MLPPERHGHRPRGKTRQPHAVKRKINAISGTGKPRWLHAVEEEEPRLRAEAVGASYLVALAGAGGTGSGTWFRIGGIDFK
jgi:hypothetical protein